MPNWCDNVAVIKHEKKEAIDRVVNAFSKAALCSEFLPTPKELLETKSPNRENAEEMKSKYGFTDWYDFQSSNWGTKWEFEGTHKRISDNEVKLAFLSAWNPPIGLYNKLVDEGYEVKAHYFEGGMAFFGEYENHDATYEQFESLDEVPKNVADLFQLHG